MNVTTSRLLAIVLCAASVGIHLVPNCYAVTPAQPTQQATASGTATRRIGAIKAINGTSITLTPDSGPDISVTVAATARIVRIPPGEKDLKNATPIQLQDLQVGDRILVGGKGSDDNLSLVASSVVAIKRSDLEARHQQDLQDWQKRGVGGLVGAVDPVAGTVTISVASFAGKKNIIIHASKTTVIRRYAQDSVKFDDAKPSALQEIHPGDQVRARGDRNPDGTDLTADEIVSGSFRNIAGIVNSVDASASTLSVQDLLTKKTVTIKVTADSQLRHLPPEMAQRIAMRLKGGASGGAAPASGSAPGSGSSQTAAPGQAATTSGGGASDSGANWRGNGAGGRSGGAPDLQQILSRMPASSLSDLHKGDAVIMVSTEGTAGVGTAIQLVSGVEAILQAAPGATSAAMLTPWSMSAPTGDAGGP
jgi:hypothetical protein